MFDSGAILLREIRSLSPLGVKGLIHKHTEITAKLVKSKACYIPVNSLFILEHLCLKGCKCFLLRRNKFSKCGKSKKNTWLMRDNDHNDSQNILKLVLAHFFEPLHKWWSSEPATGFSCTLYHTWRGITMTLLPYSFIHCILFSL